MKATLCFLGVLILAQSVVAQTAMEKANKRLADLLAPANPATTLASKPVAWPASKAVETIVLPVRPYPGVPIRLPVPAAADVKVRSAPEGTPLLAFREPPKSPKDVELPTKPLIWLPAVDVTTPVPIPILAIPVKDRASLAEPAFEASVAVALKAVTPVRDRPVPFAPLNLPDPFEHVRYGQVRNPPEESSVPPVIPLTKPK